MRFPLWLLFFLLLSLSGCSKACAPGHGGNSSGSYSYLVIPSGRMFRVLSTRAALNEEHQKLGTMVFYAGDSPELSHIETDADSLAAALGPEKEANGEKTLIVGVNLAVDAHREFAPSDSLNTVFNLLGGQWLRAPRQASDAKVLEGVGRATPPEDALFPYAPKTVEEAARAASNWLALLDAGAPDAALAEMTDAFRSQVSLAPGQWQQVIQRRNGLGRNRVELYRQQSRPTNMATPASGVTAIEYLNRAANGARVLERVTMLCEATGCKVAGYTFQPIRGD
jgi:hypothetical protein